MSHYFMRYGGEMRARHWSRTAFAMALVFGGMAWACRLLLGAWPFDGAEELACVLLAAGIYFHILGRRRLRTLPDPAILMQKAFELASSGRIDAAIALLSNAIRQNPHLWQALQYRGELYLVQQNFTAAALDFSAAIRIAPEEQHLTVLLAHATSDSGTMQESRDSEAR